MASTNIPGLALTRPTAHIASSSPLYSGHWPSLCRYKQIKNHYCGHKNNTRTHKVKKHKTVRSCFFKSNFGHLSHLKLDVLQFQIFDCALISIRRCNNFWNKCIIWLAFLNSQGRKTKLNTLQVTIVSLPSMISKDWVTKSMIIPCPTSMAFISFPIDLLPPDGFHLLLIPILP